MNKSTKKVVVFYAFFTIIGLVFSRAHFLTTYQTYAAAYGIGILMLSYLWTAWLVSNFLGIESHQIPSNDEPQPEGERKRVTRNFVMFGSMGKMFVLGGALFVGLVTLELSPVYLVSGGVVGLFILSGCLAYTKESGNPSIKQPV